MLPSRIGQPVEEVIL